MMYDFISVGGSTQDVSIFTTKGSIINNHRDILRQELLAFEYGAKIRVKSFKYTFGGGGANTAVNLSNLGFKVACLTSVGNDNIGKDILNNFRKRGVKTSLVEKKTKEQSGTSFIIISSKGDRLIFTSRGANHNLKINAKDINLLKKTKNIYISSLSGQWKTSLQKIFSIKGSKIHWNPSEMQYSAGFKKLAPFLKRTHTFALNKDEAIELVLSDKKYKQATSRFLNDVNNLLRVIKSYGPQLVMITSGKKGVDVYDGNTFYHRDILKEKKRVDTTGIGDCFNSSFVAGLELYNDIDKALSLALRNTASKIAYFGAQNGLISLK